MFEHQLYRYDDPRQLDWTDSLDPRTSAGTCEHQNEAIYAVFQRPTMQAIRLSGAYDLGVRIVPGDSGLRVAPNATFEDQFGVPPGSFLVALSASDSNGQGFRFQLKDLGSGQVLFSAPIKSRYYNRFSNGKNQNWLDKPWCLATGAVAAEVINLANAVNEIRLCLWIVSPSLDHDRIKNVYDAELEAEAQRSLSTPRALSGVNDVPDDYRTMPKTGKPFLFVRTLPAPASGTSSTIASFVVPPQTRAAMTHMRHQYNGAGWNDGDPGLVWQILVDGVAIAPGFEMINTQIGQQGFEPLAGPLTAKPGQLVEYKATATIDLAGSITCGMQGFFYPA